MIFTLFWESWYHHAKTWNIDNSCFVLDNIMVFITSWWIDCDSDCPYHCQLCSDDIKTWFNMGTWSFTKYDPTLSMSFVIKSLYANIMEYQSENMFMLISYLVLHWREVPSQKQLSIWAGSSMRGCLCNVWAAVMVSHPAQPVLTLDGVTCYMFITTVTTGSDQHKLKVWGLSLI